MSLRNLRGKFKRESNLFISEDEFLIACGIYLDFSFLNNISDWTDLPPISDYRSSFLKTKDQRIKTNQILNPMALDTRSLFDVGGTEGNNTNLQEKRNTLSSLLLDHNIYPSQVLFNHIYSYRGQPNSGEQYSHVLTEAPYSAFAICFDEDGNFIVPIKPDVKEITNQSSNQSVHSFYATSKNNWLVYSRSKSTMKFDQSIFDYVFAEYPELKDNKSLGFTIRAVPNPYNRNVQFPGSKMKKYAHIFQPKLQRIKLKNGIFVYVFFNANRSYEEDKDNGRYLKIDPIVGGLFSNSKVKIPIKLHLEIFEVVLTQDQLKDYVCEL
ncbi:MAG: hypothetical protein MH321_11435 [Leptospiraceae bacterium]|nr:hypothetical protein [Leptospiraceae bacterium]